MNNAAPDYASFVGVESADGGELSALSKLAEEQARAEARVAYIEAELNKAREDLKDLAERRVPELMDKIGIEEFRTSTGLKIKVAETIRARIPKAAAHRAFAWLREHDHAAMIKRVVSVAFGKGEDSSAEQLAQDLTDRGLMPEDHASVHPSTLSAFVREQLKAGEELPLDLFGVHRQCISKIET